MRWFKRDQDRLQVRASPAMGSAQRDAARVPGDNPIWKSEDDALDRAELARSFARSVLTLDASDGLVVGVLGAWGSGKTSFVNLSRDEFARLEVPILDFNPWMFSGTEQLVESFFLELASQLRIQPRFAEVGKRLEEYGEAFNGMAKPRRPPKIPHLWPPQTPPPRVTV